MAQPQPQPLTFDAFLDWERGQERKHEFVDGQPLATAGGTLAQREAFDRAHYAGRTRRAAGARL